MDYSKDDIRNGIVVDLKNQKLELRVTPTNKDDPFTSYSAELFDKTGKRAPKVVLYKSKLDDAFIFVWAMSALDKYLED